MAQDLTLRDYYKIFKKNKWLIAIFTFIVSVMAIIVSLMLPLWYAGTAQVIRPQSQVLNMTSMNMQSMEIFGVADASTNRYLSILNSRLLKENICKKFNLIDTYKVKWMDSAIKEFQENYEVNLGDENQIAITIFDQDQDRVADMTNYAVHLLDSINISLASEYGKEEKLFIEIQINNILDSLALLENELLDYMNTNNVLSIDDQISSEVDYATELKYQILIKETELKIMEETQKNQILADLKKIEINELKKQYDKLFAQNKELFIDLTKAPDIAVFINQMERKIAYYNEVFLFLGPLYEQAKITEAKYVPTFEVLDYAHRPDKKSKPKRSIIVISAFLFALLSSGVYVLLKETKE